MKAQGLVKPRTDGAAYTLGVNRSYSKLFPVLEIAAAAAAVTGSGASSR